MSRIRNALLHLIVIPIAMNAHFDFSLKASVFDAVKLEMQGSAAIQSVGPNGLQQRIHGQGPPGD